MAGKIGFLFPGQGAQYPGMGRSLWEVSPAVKQLFATADLLRPGTTAQCFTGAQEALVTTANTQPCLFCADLGAALALREKGVEPEAVAGFSLGEMAALTYAGVFSVETGFSLVCRRGEAMEQAAAECPGAMAAVLKLSHCQTEDLCRRFSRVYPVNYNCPGQVAVACAREELPAFCQAVREAGGKAVPLAVSGGFHSPFMRQAAGKMAALLKETAAAPPRLTVYANRTAQPYTQQTVSAWLAEQVDHPVLWQQTIEAMVSQGITHFVEVGPGKTLSGLVKKTAPQCAVYQVEDEATLLQAVQQLNSAANG